MIHVFEDVHTPRTYRYAVWTDCERSSERDGRCIGLGRTRREALALAYRVCYADLRQIVRLLERERRKGK